MLISCILKHALLPENICVYLQRRKNPCSFAFIKLQYFLKILKNSNNEGEKTQK